MGGGIPVGHIPFLLLLSVIYTEANASLVLTLILQLHKDYLFIYLFHLNHPVSLKFNKVNQKIQNHKPQTHLDMCCAAQWTFDFNF